MPNNNKKTLLLISLVFVVPVLLAKLFLSLHLYQEGATNQGQLMSPSPTLAELDMVNSHQGKWQVVYLLPTDCDSHCMQRLYILKQTHTALGVYQDRVRSIVLLQRGSDLEALQDFDFELVVASPQLSEILTDQALVIIDPLGSLVMKYALSAAMEQELQQGKALISDLRKMLKLSRIG
ncbi:hypothetical protein [Shewanella sp. NIFS-20-20]|uniref:hypothetical protein n=1 Tax=Shewanella sp. NIFS-20-20 TaxID=2853806 RepID=UPI001C48E43F|nr:hypothetical protein [Shewanella sp. NIFS-20-20]MBV7316935.1 hypothetical protein [Shewanella sp. NIFS-20-20]